MNIAESTAKIVSEGLCRYAVETGEAEKKWWFNTSRPEAKIAAAICEQCPVRDLCLNVAMAHEVSSRTGAPLATGLRFGIWGGLTPSERADAAKEKAA